MEKATVHSLTAASAEAASVKADRELAKRAARGDRQAFQRIVDEHKQRMFTVARSVIGEPAAAEDIVQDALIKAYRALPDFRGDCLLSTWLHRITYLTAIDAHRARKRYLQLAGEEGIDAEIEDDTPASRSDSTVQSTQLRQEIDEALECLSPFEQTVFTLRHMQNFKLREIALVVDRSEGTVKNILFRAIRKMRERLQDSYLNNELNTGINEGIETC